MPKTIRKQTSQKELSVVLKRLRQEAGLSINELARKSDVSAAYISKIESGHLKSLSLSKSRELAEGLGISLRVFFQELGMLGTPTRPSMRLVSEALRENGYSDDLAKDIVEYARYKKQLDRD